jgi:hypothetical protein
MRSMARLMRTLESKQRMKIVTLQEESRILTGKISTFGTTRL